MTEPRHQQAQQRRHHEAPGRRHLHPIKQDRHRRLRGLLGAHPPQPPVARILAEPLMKEQTQIELGQGQRRRHQPKGQHRRQLLGQPPGGGQHQITRRQRKRRPQKVANPQRNPARAPQRRQRLIHDPPTPPRRADQRMGQPTEQIQIQPLGPHLRVITPHQAHKPLPVEHLPQEVLRPGPRHPDRRIHRPASGAPRTDPPPHCPTPRDPPPAPRPAPAR
jgi:hypothetical protein